MASEYSVNIKLNTAQVKRDLKTIGTEISNLGKKEGKSSKTALSTTDKRLKAETQILNLQTKIQSTVNNLLKSDLKGVQAEKLRVDLITLRNNVSQKNLISSQKELALIKQKIALESQPRSRLGGRFGVQRGFDFQSALISGGFPLLFGQGPIGAIAGGLGGGIGGMFGQMGGFAGGIAATAIVQQVQNTIAAVSKLGQAFNLLTPDVESLTTALGANGTEREKQIQLIKKTEGTQAALAAVTEQLNQQIGEKGVKNLKEFGETTRLIGNAFQLLGTKMLAALAPVLKLLAAPITAGAARAETNRLANVGGAGTDPTLLDLQSQLENVRGGRSGQKQAEKIQAQIEARKEELAILGKGIERQTTVNLIEDSRLRSVKTK